MDFRDSLCNISMSSLVILAALVFEIIVRKRTDTRTNRSETPTTAVDVGN